MKFACKLKEILNEGKGVTVLYHGDDHNTKKLEPKLMNNGNNQEGVGIYFTPNLEDAETYGKDIVIIEVDTSKFLPSRELVSNYFKTKDVFKLVKDLHNVDDEEVFYLVSDYVEVAEPEDVDDNVLMEFSEYMLDEELRNFQITLADINVEAFVKSWNKNFPKILGLYGDEQDFYAVINTKIKVEKYVTK